MADINNNSTKDLTECISISKNKAIIKSVDMNEDMKIDAIDCAISAIKKYNVEKDIAAYIKNEFDKKFGTTWHCIVGRNFGSYVTHGNHPEHYITDKLLSFFLSLLSIYVIFSNYKFRSG